MSKKNISYVKGYEHSDFTDLLNELQGKNENTEMIDGALVLDAPSSMEPVCVYEESEERHRIMSDQRIKYLYSKKDHTGNSRIQYKSMGKLRYRKKSGI